MKLLLAVVALTTFAIIFASDTFDFEFLQKISKECMEQEGAGADELQIVINGTLPTTREGKCLAACLGEKFGFVS